MNNIEIKDWYEHEHSSSVFVMFTKEYEMIWCASGNELRRVYLENPDDYISGPLELAITNDLQKKLHDYYDDF